MKDLRILLIDCRIELRKALREFHRTELCQRLDKAIHNATALVEAAEAIKANPAASAAPPADGAGEHHGRRSTTHQVALAWQQAARDLKFSHPPLYENLRAKVLSRIEAKTLVDEAAEVRQLEEEVAALKASLQSVRSEEARHRESVQLERDSLLAALAQAVPELADGDDRLAVAMARIEWLRTQASKPAAAGNGVRASGAGGPHAAPASPADAEGPVPSAEVLAAVAAGLRKFNDRQREWSVAEAMVLSGFQHTPVELLAMGDANVAGIIIGAKGH